VTDRSSLVGQSVSHYRILEKLGGGGMGVVYKAEDPRLGRHVALKFLPADIANDSLAIERFRREARTASALNHPNICTIYDIGEFEGQPFIAMELLEGQTLKHRISKKSLTISEALDIGIQIADGLEAAHSRGIVHRDIKPENIFLVDRDQAKILDFGLAKLTAFRQPATSAVSESSIPTQMHFLDEKLATSQDASMGTIFYMSPEQARGENLDVRTDLFSLGVVLYQTTTGVLPFSGAVVALVFDNILHSSAMPATKINPSLPPAFENILAKAMEKDAELRYQSATELRADLKRLRRDIDSGRLLAGMSSSAAIQTPPGTPGIPSDSSTMAAWLTRHNKVVLAWIAVTAVVTATLAFALYRSTTYTPPPSSLEFNRVTGIGSVMQADISPDSKYVAYVRRSAGMQSLWLKQLATGSEVQIAAPDEDVCTGLAFSPDGNYVFFARQHPLTYQGDLYQVPALGGTPRKVLEGISGPPAFSPDGQSVAFVRNTTEGASVLMSSLDGSDERVLESFKPPVQISPFRVAWSPDGKTLAFTRVTPDWILTTMPAEGGPLHSVTGAQFSSIRDFTWLPPGRDIVVAGVLSSAPKSSPEQLYQVSSDGGNVRRITHDLATYAAVHASADGYSLLALQDQILSTIQIATPGKESEARSLSAGNQNRDGYIGVAWTPEGKVVYRSVANDRYDLWEIGGDGSSPHRLTNNGASSASKEPTVAPQGDFIVFTQENSSRHANIWRIDMDGGNPKQLTDGENNFRPSVSPDGHWVVFSSQQSGKSILMKVPSGGGAASPLTDYNSYFPSVSLDGNWIACWYFPDQNQPRLAIVPFAGGPPTKIFRLPDTSGGVLHWTPDGHSVSFLNRVSGAVNVWEQPIAGGPPKPVTHFTSDTIFYFDWFRDSRLVLSRGTEPIDAVLIKNFR
jgi:serine/threonine protein kinase